jgi:hypothetical protein
MPSQGPNISAIFPTQVHTMKRFSATKKRFGLEGKRQTPERAAAVH